MRNFISQYWWVILVACVWFLFRYGSPLAEKQPDEKYITEAREDAVEVVFRPVYNSRNRQLAIDYKSLTFKGRSGKKYSRLSFERVPQIYYRFDGVEHFLGRFSKG